MEWYGMSTLVELFNAEVIHFVFLQAICKQLEPQINILNTNYLQLYDPSIPI